MMRCGGVTEDKSRFYPIVIIVFLFGRQTVGVKEMGCLQKILTDCLRLFYLVYKSPNCGRMIISSRQACGDKCADV